MSTPHTIPFASTEERSAVTQGPFLERMLVMGWLMGGCWLLASYPTPMGRVGAVVLLGLVGLAFYSWARNILAVTCSDDALTIEAAKVTRTIPWRDVRWIWFPKVEFLLGGAQAPLYIRTRDALYYFQIKNSFDNGERMETLRRALREAAHTHEIRLRTL